MNSSTLSCFRPRHRSDSFSAATFCYGVEVVSQEDKEFKRAAYVFKIFVTRAAARLLHSDCVNGTVIVRQIAFIHGGELSLLAVRLGGIKLDVLDLVNTSRES